MIDAEPIVRLAARGDGVTASGRFVPLAAPGDRLTADGVVVPGPDHADPPCRHFPECGGCQLQHVADPAYARWLGERVTYALAGAGVAVGELMPAHLSPPRSRRRATLRAVRRGAGVAIGFHMEATHRVVDMRECHVLRPELFALVAPARALLATLLAEGDGGGVSLTLTATGIDALFSNVPADATGLARFADHHNLARLSIEGSAGIEVVALRRTPLVRLGGVEVALPPASFLQATEAGEAALQAAVALATTGARRVADLFGGVGTFALPLAAAGARVTAVDASAPAMAALAHARAPRVATFHRDLFRRPLTALEFKPFDAVVLDPPRAGAREQAAELARARVATIAYVSCNPATFARDAAIITGGGYRLARLWPIGQFRWSNHIELVAEFRR